MSLAFFDVDGTLLPFPSLERRFFWSLARAGRIPPANYLRWLKQAVRLGPWNVSRIAESNKAYLRGIPASVFAGADQCVAAFFPAALQRVWWHVLRGDRIVLVTGTLAELAHGVKLALERELRWRGVEAQIEVLATSPETKHGLLTGRVTGRPMFGREKAAAIARCASEHDVRLSECWAYGDHALDRFMLACTGNPVAVNPSPALRQTAKLYGWPVLQWNPYLSRTSISRNAFKWKGETAR
jgi:phosphoserine phosphatase